MFTFPSPNQYQSILYQSTSNHVSRQRECKRVKFMSHACCCKASNAKQPQTPHSSENLLLIWKNDNSTNIPLQWNPIADTKGMMQKYPYYPGVGIKRVLTINVADTCGFIDAKTKNAHNNASYLNCNLSLE